MALRGRPGFRSHARANAPVESASDTLMYLLTRDFRPLSACPVPGYYVWEEAGTAPRQALGDAMSVLITTKFTGDVAKGRRTFEERAGELTKFADLARSAGCLHHRFGAGDGFMLAVDEWESAEQFRKFMENPDLQAFIASSGADMAAPEVTITEAIRTADQY